MKKRIYKSYLIESGGFEKLSVELKSSEKFIKHSTSEVQVDIFKGLSARQVERVNAYLQPRDNDRLFIIPLLVASLGGGKIKSGMVRKNLQELLFAYITLSQYDQLEDRQIDNPSVSFLYTDFSDVDMKSVETEIDRIVRLADRYKNIESRDEYLDFLYKRYSGFGRKISDFLLHQKFSEEARNDKSSLAIGMTLWLIMQQLADDTLDWEADMECGTGVWTAVSRDERGSRAYLKSLPGLISEISTIAKMGFCLKFHDLQIAKFMESLLRIELAPFNQMALMMRHGI